jgi:hypothetical protein
LVIHVLNEIGNSFLNILNGSIFPELDLLGFQGLTEQGRIKTQADNGFRALAQATG